MFGNLLRECGVLERLSKTAQNELANLVTILLGLTIGSTMVAANFLRWDTLLILGLGLMFVCSGTLVTMGYGIAAGLAGKALAARMRVMNRVASVLFAGLALRMVWK